MRHILIILFTLLSLSVFGQVVRLDSTVVHESRDIYNQAGYFIGSDSFHVKRVRLVRNCVDTNYERTDTLIERRPMLFITMDSVTVGSGITEAQGDDRYVNEDVKDTITAQKLFQEAVTITDTLIFAQLGGEPIILDNQYYNFSIKDQTTGYEVIDIYDNDYPDNVVEWTTNDGLKFGTGATYLRLDYTGPYIYRSGGIPGDNSALNYGEIKAHINDSIDLTITTVTDGTTLDFTKTGRVLTGEVNTNSIDSTHLKPNSVKGSELLDVGTAGTYNNVTTDADGRVQSGSLLAYQTGTQVRDSIGLLDADHDGDADDAELLQGANGSYYRARANHSGVQDTSTITALDEFVEDRINETILISGGSKSYNDATGELTLTVTGGATDLSVTGASSPYTVASSTGTDFYVKASTNMTITESNDTLIFASSGGGSGLTDEQVRDTVANFIRETANGGIDLVESDSGDSMTIAGKFKYLNENLIWDSDGQYCIWNGASQVNATATWGCHFTVVGTVTAPTMGTSNIVSGTRRSELIGATSTSSVGGLRETVVTNWFGNAAGRGGFTFKMIWAPLTGITSNSNHRAFAGMKDGTSAPSDVDPSTLTGMFGMAWDDDDTNIQFMHNDASGTATKVDLGTDFPVPTTDRTDFYKLEMYVEPNTSTVYYKVTDMTDLTTVSGSVSSNLPTSTTFFGPRGYVSAGGTSTASGFGIIKLIIKTEY